MKLIFLICVFDAPTFETQGCRCEGHHRQCWTGRTCKCSYIEASGAAGFHSARISEYSFCFFWRLQAQKSVSHKVWTIAWRPTLPGKESQGILGQLSQDQETYSLHWHEGQEVSWRTKLLYYPFPSLQQMSVWVLREHSNTWFSFTCLPPLRSKALKKPKWVKKHFLKMKQLKAWPSMVPPLCRCFQVSAESEVDPSSLKPCPQAKTWFDTQRVHHARSLRP